MASPTLPNPLPNNDNDNNPKVSSVQVEESPLPASLDMKEIQEIVDASIQDIGSLPASQADDTPESSKGVSGASSFEGPSVACCLEEQQQDDQKNKVRKEDPQDTPDDDSVTPDTPPPGSELQEDYDEKKKKTLSVTVPNQQEEPATSGVVVSPCPQGKASSPCTVPSVVVETPPGPPTLATTPDEATPATTIPPTLGAAQERPEARSGKPQSPDAETPAKDNEPMASVASPLNHDVAERSNLKRSSIEEAACAAHMPIKKHRRDDDEEEDGYDDGSTDWGVKKSPPRILVPFGRPCPDVVAFMRGKLDIYRKKEHDWNVLMKEVLSKFDFRDASGKSRSYESILRRMQSILTDLKCKAMNKEKNRKSVLPNNDKLLRKDQNGKIVVAAADSHLPRTPEFQAFIQSVEKHVPAYFSFRANDINGREQVENKILNQFVFLSMKGDKLVTSQARRKLRTQLERRKPQRNPTRGDKGVKASAASLPRNLRSLPRTASAGSKGTSGLRTDRDGRIVIPAIIPRAGKPVELRKLVQTIDELSPRYWSLDTVKQGRLLDQIMRQFTFLSTKGSPLGQISARNKIRSVFASRKNGGSSKRNVQRQVSSDESTRHDGSNRSNTSDDDQVSSRRAPNRKESDVDSGSSSESDDDDDESVDTEPTYRLVVPYWQPGRPIPDQLRKFRQELNEYTNRFHGGTSRQQQAILDRLTSRYAFQNEENHIEGRAETRQRIEVLLKAKDERSARAQRRAASQEDSTRNSSNGRLVVPARTSHQPNPPNFQAFDDLAERNVAAYFGGTSDERKTIVQQFLRRFCFLDQHGKVKHEAAAANKVARYFSRIRHRKRRKVQNAVVDSNETEPEHAPRPQNDESKNDASLPVPGSRTILTKPSTAAIDALLARAQQLDIVLSELDPDDLVSMAQVDMLFEISGLAAQSRIRWLIRRERETRIQYGALS